MHAIPKDPEGLSVSISEARGRRLLFGAVTASRHDNATGATVYRVGSTVEVHFHPNGRTVVRGPESHVHALLA